ncbi:MAG: ribulose-phosphate 3-epimerase [bacterium]
MRKRETRPLIAPSILSADFSCLGRQVEIVENAGADLLHIDVMDGHFVPNITIGPLVVRGLSGITRLPLDVHLMIQQPERYIVSFKEAGANWLTIHIEVPGHHQRMIQQIKELGMKAGVALNPATPLNTLEWLISDLDLILIMSVNPGFGGQSFIPFCLDKIKRARDMIDKHESNAILAVDGGVKTDNCLEVAEAGADMMVMGSAVFGSTDPEVRIKQVRDRLKSISVKE